MNIDPHALYGAPIPQPAPDLSEALEKATSQFLDMGEKILFKIDAIKVPSPKDDKWMNTKQLCDYIHITANQLYKMRRENRLPCHKPKGGKQLFFMKEEIDAWIKSSGASLKND